MIAELNTTSSGHALMKYLGPSCESKREGGADEAKAHGHPSAQARQRDAESPVETKGRNSLGYIQAVEQAALNRTSLPPSKTLTVPCLLRGRRAEVNTTGMLPGRQNDAATAAFFFLAAG